jgi:cytochrome c-type biogenesis protein CcmF
MIPEIGEFALVMALCTALVQAIVPLAGAQARRGAWIAVAPRAAQAQFLFVLIAFSCLTWAFVDNDFSVAYVATNSNSSLPLHYRIAAVWGAHEGSLLLWALILAGWTVAVSFFSASLPVAFAARVIAVMGLVAVGFLLFMLTTSSPFERLLPAAVEGRDLNPLLQDPGLIMHPPMLYMGYVGMAVPFSFAIAALLDGRLDETWSRWTRPWTLVAWTFLTLGIALGSWWAYYELGWGGWWFWDPVENASFMPWLVATALLHSLAVTDKRGAFKAWTVILSIFSFSLSLLGTFLVRSGVLVSVHAFATDPARGVFILVFLSVVIGAALLLYAWRAGKVAGGGGFALLSRESLLLTNNVLLCVAAATVLLGTLYPLILDAAGLGKVSVGPPYFNAVFVPLMLPLVFLIGIGPLTRWKRETAGELARQLKTALWVSALLGAGLMATVSMRACVLVAVGLVLSVWVAYVSLLGLLRRVRHLGGGIRGLRNLPRAFLGMTVAHFGVAVFVAGVTVASSYSVEQDVRMRPGDSARLGRYEFRFTGVTTVPGPNYEASRGELEVSVDGRQVAALHPEKRRYLVQAQPMTEAAIDAGVLRDLYVALGEPLADGAWSLRLHYKPLVRWIWFGPLLMGIGGLLGAGDRRYRMARPVRVATPAGALPVRWSGN